MEQIEARDGRQEGDASGATALILIEPTPELCEVLAERLRMQGYVVQVVRSAAEGARLALLNPPAAVIANLWMPSISGVQLCRLLRSEPATRDIPIILRGPDGQRNRFWAERAGAAAYVVKGRMGDLVRALSSTIARAPQGDGFFTDLGQSGDIDIRDRIAAYLDTALFESVIAAEVRRLSVCGAFGRLFDLFSQFTSQVTSYRWLATMTNEPLQVGIHAHPAQMKRVEEEVRHLFQLSSSVRTFLVEDEDALEAAEGPDPLILPVKFSNELMGKIAFAGSQQSEAQDLQIMSIIANELGGPLRMATLVEEAERLATTDPLTGLMNRRAFVKDFDVEIERASQLSTPLGVMLLDVDHFKSINDTRGHAAGDAVLASLGRLIHRQARKVDLVARWGGEEFVVALVGAAPDWVVAVAERFRAAVEALEVTDDRGSLIPFTASFGVAVFAPGEDAAGLIDRADRAMYAAKSAGRNRVRLAPAPQDAPLLGPTVVPETPKLLGEVAGH